MSMDDASGQARRLIEATPHLTLATADASGKPWSCPVYFAHDQAFTLYWVSFRQAVHSANIRVRPQVGISILGEPPDHEGDGVYFRRGRCRSSLMHLAEVEAATGAAHAAAGHGVCCYLARRCAGPRGVADSTQPFRWPFTEYHDAAEIVHGQHVDVRVKVTLEAKWLVELGGQRGYPGDVLVCARAGGG